MNAAYILKHALMAERAGPALDTVADHRVRNLPVPGYPDLSDLNLLRKLPALFCQVAAVALRIDGIVA